MEGRQTTRCDFFDGLRKSGRSAGISEVIGEHVHE
jgi:hypothetical protein